MKKKCDDKKYSGWICWLMVKAKLAESNSKARDLIMGGAVTLDGKKITDPKANILYKDGSMLKVGRQLRRLRVPVQSLVTLMFDLDDYQDTSSTSQSGILKNDQTP